MYKHARIHIQMGILYIYNWLTENSIDTLDSDMKIAGTNFVGDHANLACSELPPLLA